MECTIDYMDLVRLIETTWFGKDNADVVATFLEDCIDFQLDLTNYLWNILPFFVQVFDTMEEAEEYRKNNYEEDYWEDCTIYDTGNGVYFEGC